MREVVIACTTSDRTFGLVNGQIPVDGVPYRIISIDPGSEIFYRMYEYEEFDVAEMSLATYATAVARGDDRFVAIPVFMSRAFRHGSVFVAEDSDITDPAQLRGRRVGMSEYEMTAGVWIRGMFGDDYGVAARDVEWVTLREEKVKGIPHDPTIKVTRRPEIDFESALVGGELDALAYVALPRRLGRGIRRLFVDYRSVERDYYQRTKIFPIMHTLVIRRSVYEQQPWLARSLYKAFAAARDQGAAHLYRAQALAVMVPSLLAAIEEDRAAFGGDPWTYGVAENAHVLKAFCRYLTEQGLADRELGSDELFVPVQASNQGLY